MADRRDDVLDRELPGEDPATFVTHEGQFHQVVMGAHRVVCFARTPSAADRLPKRVEVLRIVDGLGLDVGIPRPVSTAGTAYAVFTRVPGEPIDFEQANDPTVADAMAADLTPLLRALAAEGATSKASALPGAPADRWSSFARDVRSELYRLMTESGRARAEAELAEVTGVAFSTTSVVHGDLGGENLLWEWHEGVPHLTGVVDWDGVVLGDQSEDLAALAASYGDGLLDRLLHRLEASDDVRGRIAAIRGTFALQQALSAVQDGDQEQLDDGLAGYRGADPREPRLGFHGGIRAPQT